MAMDSESAVNNVVIIPPETYEEDHSAAAGTNLNSSMEEISSFQDPIGESQAAQLELSGFLHHPYYRPLLAQNRKEFRPDDQWVPVPTRNVTNAPADRDDTPIGPPNLSMIVVNINSETSTGIVTTGINVDMSRSATASNPPANGSWSLAPNLRRAQVKSVVVVPPIPLGPPEVVDGSIVSEPGSGRGDDRRG